MAFITKSDGYSLQIPHVNPTELADTSDGIAPSGFPIMSSCFIVDKMDIAVCDGSDKWYIATGTGVASIEAGQAWAELYSE